MVVASINVLAILLAVAAKQALGLLWYSPMLFGASLAQHTGQTPEDRRARMGRALTWDTLGTVATALALACLIRATRAESWFYGLLLGLGLWLAFAVPAAAGPVLFEGRSARLFGLRMGCLAVSYGVMGAILGAWR
jgi:hypothetical protein